MIFFFYHKFNQNKLYKIKTIKNLADVTCVGVLYQTNIWRTTSVGQVVSAALQYNTQLYVDYILIYCGALICSQNENLGVRVGRKYCIFFTPLHLFDIFSY